MTNDNLHKSGDQLDEDVARGLAYLQTLSLPAFLRDTPLDVVSDEELARAVGR